MPNRLARHGITGQPGTPPAATTPERLPDKNGELAEMRLAGGGPDLSTEDLDKIAAEILVMDSASTAWRMVPVMAHRKASRELLLMGATSGEVSWVAAVASNVGLPDDIAKLLLSDRTLTRLDEVGALLLHGGDVTRVSQIEIRKRVVAVTSLEVLGGHSWGTELSPSVLMAALDRFASEQARPIALMQRVADQLMSVATSSASLQVAAKWTTDPARLLQLCAHASRWVRHEAEQNVACPEEGRVMVALLN